MTEHTPGPWRFEKGQPFDYPPPNGKRHDHCIIGTGVGNLGEPFHHVADAGYAGSKEVQANARLIAAAPELLEALEIMLSDKRGHFARPAFDNREAIDYALAAIAKAKG